MIKRDPSLHVTKSTLISLLKSYSKQNELELPVSHLTEYLLINGVRNTPTNRLIVHAKTVKQGKAIKKEQENLKDYDAFNRVLADQRVLLKHKGASVLANKDSTEYKKMCSVADIAYEYLDVFYAGSSLDERNKALIDFIQYGISLMGPSYNLQKFHYHKESIFNRARYIQEIKEDEDSDTTFDTFKYYYEKYTELTGFKVNLTNFVAKKPEIYIHFLRAAQDIIAQNASVEDWVDAQFEGLSFTNTIPKESQMYGDNALRRYHNYYYQARKQQDAAKSDIKTYQSRDKFEQLILSDKK